MEVGRPLLLWLAVVGASLVAPEGYAQQNSRDGNDGFPLDIQFTRTAGDCCSIPPTFLYSTQAALESSSVPRSPLIAGLLSTALPGLGQAYADHWEISWRSAAYIAVEAGLWAAVISYNNKGDVQTEEFQLYADQHWDVSRYAGWIETNIGQLNSSVNTSGMIISTDPALAPWDRVSWTRLNEVEEGIGQVSGTGFTHRLPQRPEQQYYELIGKYAQYGGGWDDAAGFTPSDVKADVVSPRFLEYSRMRGRANDLYAIATSASYLIVANHVISALEAAWSTSRANRSLNARAEMRRLSRGEFVEQVPHLVVTWRM